MTAFLIRRPVLVAMLLVGACLLGGVSYTRLPVELIPFAELPMLIVYVGSARDGDPHYLEQQAVIPLESAIASLEDIERIESYIQPRQATLFVYYTPSSRQQYAYLKLQERVDATRPQLGDEFQTLVWKIDTEQLANQFMSLQARGTGSLDQIRHVVDQHVVRDLEQIDGIANVSVYGGRQRSIEVRLDEDLLRSHGLTVSQVASRLSQSARPRRYLGQAVEQERTHFVNLTTEYTSLDDLGQTVVEPNASLRLEQLAVLVDGGAERETIARVDGMEAITISLVRDRQANLLDLSRATRRQIEQLNESLAVHGVELAVTRDSAEPIEENIGDIQSLALVGALLAVAVLWAFLRNLRLVAVIALAIPISVLISFNLFYALDLSLNTLSLVGIAIAVGMLLDNSIVVLENIYRRLARGGDAREAVVAGVGEVWRAVSAATLTTICVFLPFVFSENFLVRTLGRHVGVSIISTLLVSLAVAFLLIPVCAFRLLGDRSGRTDSFNVVSQRHRLVQVYTLLLKSCLRFPARTLGWATVAFFLSILLCVVVSVNAPEEVELTSFDLYATFPTGTTLELADEQARDMDGRLADIEELAERRAEIRADYLHFTFELQENYREIARRNLRAVAEESRDRLSKAFPRVEFSYDQPRTDVRFRSSGERGAGRAFQRLLGIGSARESIVLRGRDLSLLQTIAEDIRFNLERLTGVNRARVEVTAGQPTLDLRFDRSALAHFGISPATVAAELSGFQPQVSSGARLKSGTEEIDVILKSDPATERRADDLRRLQIPTPAGGSVPLLQLAELTYAAGYGHIDRVNQEKQVELTYDFAREIHASNQLLDESRAAVDRLVAGLAIPPGVAVEVVHDELDLSEFYFLIAASVVLIYMILTSVFESLVAPLSMMITLPLATIGAFWGLILTGNSIFNANVLIGFLILLGVVVNNGIMLIDYARLLQRRGFRLGRALLAAGQIRVRPILITALSTILAMLPLAMGKAEYVGRIGAPFAITVIGGLVAGTLFTLVLVPTVYFGLFRSLSWLRVLPWPLQVVQLAALAGGWWLIYAHVDSTFWQFADGTALLAAIPGLTHFARSSLRRSRSSLIPPGAPIHISVRNLVKIYDERSRFARQWGRYARQQAHGQAVGPRSLRTRLASLTWQLALLAFHGYFTYFYLDSEFYILLFSIGIHLFLLALVRVHLLLLRPRLGAWLYQLVLWILPLPHLFWFQRRWDEPALVGMVGFLWYLGVLVHYGAQQLHQRNIDVNRLAGRFRRTRKAFYRLVGKIPLIGRRRSPFRALDQVSLEIDSGMFGLIGPNGAGKTTLMRIVCGILESSRGAVRVNGLDLRAHREELQALIGYLPQEFGTYENMTARQFLDYQAMLKGQWDGAARRRAVDGALRAVHLEESADRRIGGFSGGMKQRVGIAQTLLHLPRLLVVDEPTAGLDPRERIRFRNLLAGLARDRVVLFSTHIIEDISSSCNRLAVFDKGRVRFFGSPQQMVQLAQDAVWQARVSGERFEQLRAAPGEARIVHHMRDDDRIRVRLLAAHQPLPEAEPVTPTLEDAYLWLLEQKEE